MSWGRFSGKTYVKCWTQQASSRCGLWLQSLLVCYYKAIVDGVGIQPTCQFLLFSLPASGPWLCARYSARCSKKTDGEQTGPLPWTRVMAPTAIYTACSLSFFFKGLLCVSYFFLGIFHAGLFEFCWNQTIPQIYYPAWYIVRLHFKRKEDRKSWHVTHITGNHSQAGNSSETVTRGSITMLNEHWWQDWGQVLLSNTPAEPIPWARHCAGAWDYRNECGSLCASF